MLKARFGFSGTRCSQCSGFWVHLGEKVRVFEYSIECIQLFYMMNSAVKVNV